MKQNTKYSLVLIGIIALGFSLKKYFAYTFSYLRPASGPTMLKRKLLHDEGIRNAENACPWDLKLGEGMGKVKLGAPLNEFKKTFPDVPIVDEKVARLGFFAVAFQDGKVRAISITPLKRAPDCFTIEGQKMKKIMAAEDFAKLTKGCTFERTHMSKELVETVRCPGYFKAVSSPGRPEFTRVSLDLNERK